MSFKETDIELLIKFLYSYLILASICHVITVKKIINAIGIFFLNHFICKYNLSQSS